MLFTVKYIILILVFLLVIIGSVSAQSAELLQGYGDCKKELQKISDDMGKCNENYRKGKEELASGLFCSDCSKPKSQIEREYRISFEKHIQDGAKTGRHARSANQADYDKLNRSYLSEFNSLKSQFESKQKNCDDTRDLYNKVKNQELADNNKKIQQENSERYKKAQEENRKKIEDQQNKQQAELRAKLEQIDAENLRNQQTIASIQNSLNNLGAALNEATNNTTPNEEATAVSNEINKYKEMYGDGNIKHDSRLSSDDSHSTVGSVVNQSGGSFDFDNISSLPVIDDFVKDYESLPSDYAKKLLLNDNAQEALQIVQKTIENLNEKYDKLTGIIKEIKSGEVGENTQQYYLDATGQTGLIRKIQNAALKEINKVHSYTINQLNNVSNSIEHFNDEDYCYRNSSQLVNNSSSYSTTPKSTNRSLQYAKKAFTVVGGAALVSAGSITLPVAMAGVFIYNLFY